MSLKKVLRVLLRGIAVVVVFLLTFILLLIAFIVAVERIDMYFFRLGHGARVTAVAFSPVAFAPECGILASGSFDQTVRLWRVPDGAPIRTLIGHEDYVTSVAFSPGGKLLASASDDQTVRLWRVADGTLLRVLAGHEGFVTALSFSPTGPLLASASEDRTLKVWRPADGTLVWATRTNSWLDGILYEQSEYVLLGLNLLFSVLVVIGFFRLGRRLLRWGKTRPRAAPTSSGDVRREIRRLVHGSFVSVRLRSCSRSMVRSLAMAATWEAAWL